MVLIFMPDFVKLARIVPLSHRDPGSANPR
jgi:hypothetical protein